MDSKDDSTKVSLPGAGGTEPTILEVLNRNIVSSDSDNEREREPQSDLVDESDGCHQDTDYTEDPDARLVTSVQVTDLDLDDSTSDSKVLEFESHLIEDLNGSKRSSGIFIDEIVTLPADDERFDGKSTSDIGSSVKDEIYCDKSTIESIPSDDVILVEEKRLPQDEPQIVEETLKQSTESDIEEFLKTEKEASTIDDGNAQNTQHETVKTDLTVAHEQETVIPHHEDIVDIKEEAEQVEEEFKNLVQATSSDIGSSSDQVQLPSSLVEETSKSVSEEVQPETEENKSSKELPNDPGIQEKGLSLASSLEQLIAKLKEVEEYLPVHNGESKSESSEVPDLLTTHPNNKTLNHLDTNGSDTLKDSDSFVLANEAKKEYYQHLRDYLNNEELNRPPIPLQTYRWEDIRRSKQLGGYPWTHLYKKPLAPDEEPEIIQIRRSQDRSQKASESPKSLKKVRIHEEVLVKETERYISDLSDEESEEERDHNEEDDEDEDEEDHEVHHLKPEEEFHIEDTRSVQSEPASLFASEGKSSRINKLKGILKRRLPSKSSGDDSSQGYQSGDHTPIEKKKADTLPRKSRFGLPIMDKIRSMADKQLRKRHIKKVPLKDNEKIVLSEKQKILKLKSSPKADRGEIPHFVEKQDSDEILEIVELEESPSKARKRRENLSDKREETSILVPDEIIEIPPTTEQQEKISVQSEEPHTPTASPAASDILEEELRIKIPSPVEQPPFKAPRRRKEHIYEDIEDDLEAKIDEILEEAVAGAMQIKMSMEMAGDAQVEDQELRIVEDHDKEELLDAKEPELKSALKREPSPSSDKKVTFSHVEDEAEPHREDVVLPEEYRAPAKLVKGNDHEYEPIGQPLDENERSKQEKEPSPIPTVQVSEPMDVDEGAVVQKSTLQQKLQAVDTSSLTSLERQELEDAETSAFDQQREIEDRYFSSIPTTPRTDSRTDNEIHTSQVDSSAIEELPLRAEDRKKGFMASAQDRSRKMQENIRTQAGKIRTKLRGTKKPPSGSPKAKERKRFKAPDFSKIKMPEIKKPELPKFKTPEMPKFKEFKRPEFTKFDKPIFTKPDMSKFKVPDRIAIKLRRTKSLKETEVVTTTDTTPETASPAKKKFEFNFGTYPRMLKKRRQKLSTQVIARADDFPSTESPPSIESATIPRAPRDKGPVGSRWADKFSDVSYADSESGKYQRYGSEVESLGRESSVEQRIKDDLERAEREEEELEKLRTHEEQQFADYDEENRAIHEISKIREEEFKKRKPIVHQDSDLVSDEGKEIGWTEKDILRNTMLRRDEVDIDHLQEPYPSEEGLTGSNTNTNQETQSTGSSGILRQKGVLEEIDDDEFFLRKRGISQDNIEIRQYISTAIREGLGTPSNALAKLGTSESYPEMDISNEQVHYGYDVPPPKPRRAKNFNNFDRGRDSREISQDYDMGRKGSFDDNTSLPQTDDRYFSNFPPSRPLRKSKKQYSEDSQEDHEVPMEDIPYFDDGDERMFYKKVNVPDYDQEDQDIPFHDDAAFSQVKATPPKVPRRRKKQKRESMEKEAYSNRFSGRSISNSYLQGEEQPEDVVVYRTQHEYPIPLAQGETFTTPTPTPRRSRSRSQSQSRITDDDRTSRGAESLTSDQHPGLQDKYRIDMKENDGYAIVRKEPPPRPPAPNRRKRSQSPFNDRQFSTMPHMRGTTSVPERPKRNYSTIGPSRPPRRKSSTHMGDAQTNVSSPDVTQYEELDLDDEEEEDRVDSPRDLHSGDVINKMKYRPLPPPPRPPREGKKHREPRNRFDDKHDMDGGGEKIFSDIQRNGNYDIEKFTDKCIEVEVSTQTDPLPDDFVCEEFEITDDMRIIEPRRTKTLEDILKEEQEAEIERARQLADDDSLARGLQRFREAGQRSFSERSKDSTADRSRASLSRPTTPSAVVIERRVPTPIPHREGGTLLEASLTVFPVDDIDLEQEDQLDEDKVQLDPIPSESGETNQEEEQRLSIDHVSDREISAEIEESLERDESVPEDEEVPPPLPPPRKRSSIASVPSVEQEEERKETHIQETALLPVTQEIEHPPEQPVLPSRLAIAELEVERLSVNALQAGRIVVSQLQGSSITADEFDCKSSNLPSRTLDLPPGFIEEIIERVRSKEREQVQAQQPASETKEDKPPAQSGEEKIEPTTEQPPMRPPLPQHPIFPSEYMQYSLPPASFYQLRNPSDEELHPHSPTHRRRRHHRRRDSSSEDDGHREHRRSRHSTQSPEPSVSQLGGQLLSACGSSMMRAMTQLANLLRTNEKEGSERHISTAIVIVILMTIGFLLLGISGDKNIHHHHWDYFNPPGNQGRE